MNMIHDDQKKSKRIAAIVYLLFMAFIVTGTLISQQNKEEEKAGHSVQK